MIDNRGISFYLFLFLFGIYFLTAQGNNIGSSDQQQVRFAVTHSIIEEGDLSIPDGLGVKGNHGKDYSWYGIGQPVLAIPFYVIGRTIAGYGGAQVMVSMMNQAVVALGGVIVFLFVTNLGYSKKTALMVTVFYAFGTFAWPQSKHPFDHPVEMLFVLLAVFYAQIFAKCGNARYLILSSSSLGFAFLTRPPAVLSMLPIFIFLTFNRLKNDSRKDRVFATIRDCAVYSIAFAPFVAVQLWYNYARFGSVYETGITLMAGKAGLDFFAGTPFFTGLAGFLISPGKGFFYYSPVSILFFLSISGFYTRNKGLALCLLGIASSYIIFLSKNIYWHGDWSWGPRYLFVITPLILIPVADFIERSFWNGGRVLRYAVLLLFGLSIAVQIIGVSVDFNRYFFSLQAEEGVRFTSVGGNDVPYIVEPPPDTHFDWDKFPIVYQAGSALKIWNDVKKLEKTNDVQQMDVFDFWWLYALYLGAPAYAVLTVLGILLFMMAVCCHRLLKSVGNCNE